MHGRAYQWIATIGMLGLLIPGTAFTAQVDLNTWTAESYPAVPGFGAGVWTVAPDGSAVTQSVNGQPTIFYSDFNAMGTDVRGTIRVTGGDDDFIGFVLGFNPGDTTNASADYLLMDWKGVNQFYDFGGNSTAGGVAPAGLAVSRVTGIPNADEFWQHIDDPADTNGAAAELARGTTLGNTGWSTNTDYDFQFIFQPNRLRVYVDGTLELDVLGLYSNGRMGFYNFSQAGVIYSAFTVDPAPGVVPEPATISLMGIGLAGLGIHRRRRLQHK